MGGTGAGLEAKEERTGVTSTRTWVVSREERSSVPPSLWSHLAEQSPCLWPPWALCTLTGTQGLPAQWWRPQGLG